MHNTINTNVRNGKSSLRTFGIFAVIFLMGVLSTWWITRHFYDTSEATDRAFLRLDSSLNNAGKFLTNACKEDSLYMEDRVKQPGFEKIVIQWKPKVDSTLLLTRQIIQLLDELSSSINQSSVSVPDNLSEPETRTQTERSTNIDKLKTGHTLYDS